MCLSGVFCSVVVLCRAGSLGLSWVPFLSVGGETRLWTWCSLASGVTCPEAGAVLSPPWVLSLFPWVSVFRLSGLGSLCWGSAPSGYFLNSFKWGVPCLGYPQTCSLALGGTHTQVWGWGVENLLPLFLPVLIQLGAPDGREGLPSLTPAALSLVPNSTSLLAFGSCKASQEAAFPFTIF